MARKAGGPLVLDDSTPGKHHAREIDLVGRHRSGKHQRVAWGIKPITLARTDGDRVVRRDYRPSEEAKDGRTEDDHSPATLREAEARGVGPRCVAFESWGSGPEDLEAVRGYGRAFLRQLKVNRGVGRDRRGYRAVAGPAIAPGGTVVHREGFGSVRVFGVVSRAGDLEYRATHDLAMGEVTRLAPAEPCRGIENHHRGLEPCRDVERVRAARAPRDPIGVAIRASLRREHRFSTTGVGWYEAEARIIRGAVRACIANPVYSLP